MWRVLIAGDNRVLLPTPLGTQNRSQTPELTSLTKMDIDSVLFSEDMKIFNQMVFG